MSRCLPHLARRLARSSRTAARQPASMRRCAITDARSPHFGLLAHRMESAAVVVARKREERLRSLRVHCSLCSLRLALVSRCLPHLARRLARSSWTAARQPGSVRRCAILDARSWVAMAVQPRRSSHCLASQASYALGLSVSTLSAPADFAFSHACSSLTVQTMTMSPAFFNSLT